MSVIDELQGYLLKHPPQLDNLWEFTIESVTDNEFSNNMKFLVTDVSIPFPKLLYETAFNGEKYYTGVQFPDEFQITVKEVHNPSTLAVDSSAVLGWWNRWINQNYDFTSNVFIEDLKGDAHRTGTLRFLTYGVEITPIAAVPIMRDMIVDNIILSIARGVASRVEGISGSTDALSIISNATGRDINVSLKPPTIHVPIGLSGGTAFEREVVVAEFMFVNLKPVGIEPLSLTYSDGKPMEYRLALTCDRLKTE